MKSHPVISCPTCNETHPAPTCRTFSVEVETVGYSPAMRNRCEVFARSKRAAVRLVLDPTTDDYFSYEGWTAQVGNIHPSLPSQWTDLESLNRGRVNPLPYPARFRVADVIETTPGC